MLSANDFIRSLTRAMSAGLDKVAQVATNQLLFPIVMSFDLTKSDSTDVRIYSRLKYTGVPLRRLLCLNTPS